MKNKPALSLSTIWNMCFGFFGIQFGFALQNANTSRIFQTLGAEIETIPLLWLAAPITGLIVQPLVGYLSDNTWTKLGRRRPYFLVGAVIATFTLIVMPNSAVLWVAVATLWVMDAAINLTMEPFRALVGDRLPHRQRALGFAVQSFFISLGAVIASALPLLLTKFLSIANTAPDGELPPSVLYAFYIGAGVMLFSILWTSLTTEEYPNENQLSSLNINKNNKASTRFRFAVSDFIQSIKDMPAIMQKLALVQIFTWFALFSLWIYATPAITTNYFHSESTNDSAYNIGANWVGLLFASYNGFAALAAIVIPYLTKRISETTVHSLCLGLGALGFFSLVNMPNANWLFLSMLGIGIAWASILSLPYAILANAIPDQKMGVYIGVFNIFIVLPQILAASILGFLVKVIFNGETIYALLIGGLSLTIAALLTYKIKNRLQFCATRLTNNKLCRQ